MSDALVADAGGEKDANAVLLGTLKTRHIRNERRKEWSPEKLRQDVQMCLKDYPDNKVRSVTAIYNCVGMVFSTRRTWIEPSLVYKLLYDDDYVMLPSTDDAQVGDVAIYKTSAGVVKHVGIVIERKIDVAAAKPLFQILSKWGPWAEFIHKPGDIFPAWGSFVEAWTDRKTP